MNCTMTRRSLISVLSLCTIAAALPAGAADTVNRKRERPVSGEVSAISKTEVSVKVTAPKADTIKVPANEILGIEWNSEPPECKVARSDENGGRYQKAIDGYQ